MSPYDIICDAVGDRELARRITKKLNEGGYTFVTIRHQRDLESSMTILAQRVAELERADVQRQRDKGAIWGIVR